MLPDTKRRARHRAKIIRGQVDSLLHAIETERYCVDLLTLSRSVQRSLKSLDALILEHHLSNHAKEQLADSKHAARSVRELVEIYNLANK